MWIDDKNEGYGVYTLKNGGRYEGMFHNDLYHGYGKETWANGASYEGEFLEGEKQGQGTYI